MNTFAYVGDLENNPEISCVYQSDDTANDFKVMAEQQQVGSAAQKAASTAATAAVVAAAGSMSADAPPLR